MGKTDPPPSRKLPGSPRPDDRRWSAHANLHPRDATTDLVRFTSLPAETGPVWAPDRLSIWPVEGGRYGIDAHYQGPTGSERAKSQQRRLQAIGLPASLRTEDDGGLIRLGPFTNDAVWLALKAFLGEPGAPID